MSVNKHSSIFLRQLATIAYIFTKLKIKLENLRQSLDDIIAAV